LRYDLERQRQDFLSTTSHELRTPVTIIAGYSELLAESELPVEAATWVDAIHRNTNRLATMLDDLLAFSRTQAEQPRPVEVAASELVSTAIARHIDAATARALALTVAPITDLMVIADRDDAARALGNLISNAVKFTPDEGSIHIETARVADDVMITVGDTGPGIGPDGLVQAFDPFYRGAQSEVRAMAGTGLGLPIARMLARRNGGEVMLVSLPGLGTKATLLLPRAGASREGEESAEAGQ
jgi:signal transduction histidine kinase